MPKKNFEIGVTYIKNNKYFIAVREDSLATWEHGKFTVSKPILNHIACRHLPVEDLCNVWNIKTQQLDELSKEFFTPEECRDQTPSERTARKNDVDRDPPIKVARYIRQ